jgi:hypothetical protein
MKQLFLLSLFVGLGVLVAGCDDETHPDPQLVQSANAQRQAQNPGNAQAPQTPPGK